MHSSIQVFRYSGIQVFRYSSNHIQENSELAVNALAILSYRRESSIANFLVNCASTFSLVIMANIL